ncbi:MAG: hypothetical protein K0S08_815 [Gammaproteobacteria bacterium]|jgi:hypothetical protein|nr:hypothetical protein [Gammaproteobacteria bacterium]
MLKYFYRPKYYAAIYPTQENYLLAAIKKYRGQVSFEGFCQGSLTDLAILYSKHKLAICVPEETILHQTWFFPKHLSSTEIYQQIAAQQKPHTYFDIELLSEENHLDEYLVISNCIEAAQVKAITQTYELLGFSVAAIESYAHVAKRQLTQAWQVQAFATVSAANQAAAQIVLKLLDRENFYDAEFIGLA